MKSLLILRHADAGPAEPGQTDLERGLSPLGHSQGNALGAYLRDQGITPDAVVCSAATRARQTAQSVIDAAQWSLTPATIDALYNGSVEDLAAFAEQQADSVEQLMIVAHAPGVAELAALLTTQSGRLNLYYQPCTLAEVAIEASKWSSITPNCGSLVRLLPPM